MVDPVRAVLAACLLAGSASADCTGGDLDLEFRMSAAVPYSVELEEDGTRLVLEARSDASPEPVGGRTECVLASAPGADRGDSGTVVLDLAARFELRSASLNGTNIVVVLKWIGRKAPMRASDPAAPQALPLIVIDPGHGGVDAGAVRDQLKESDLTLAYARALSETLIRSGRFRVALSRQDDAYVSLADRVGFARDEGAAAFLSLHADALDEGSAHGGAVFTLSETASDAAAAELVAMHDRADLLVGETLAGAGDTLAGVILDLARSETAPRSEALARALVDALAAMPGALRKGALRSANFGVLKAPDIPSVLIELGFMSDEGDLANLSDPEWRAAAVAALGMGILAWADADAVAAGLRRK